MADITLAEFQGRVWLVGGEPFIDDLLANTLADNVTIELVPCERRSDIHALWVQHCGAQSMGGDPWMIHPAIVARIRRNSAAAHSVFFAEWSAKLDQDANTVIASVTAWAGENPEAPLTLVEFLDPDGPAAVADLSHLRARLIEDKLVGGGIARERIRRATRGLGDVVGMAQESQRIDIAVQVAEPSES
jgi:outer membrane protein OmpA-like peptidoglycan-associated protein